MFYTEHSERCNAFRSSLSGWSERLYQKVLLFIRLNPLDVFFNFFTLALYSVLVI